MRPNTPHAVFTPTEAVCEGGHFFATSTLQDTLVGIVHAFMAGNLVTNTEHASARCHLQEMIAFFHLALIRAEVEEEGEYYNRRSLVNTDHKDLPSKTSALLTFPTQKTRNSTRISWLYVFGGC